MKTGKVKWIHRISRNCKFRFSHICRLLNQKKEQQMIHDYILRFLACSFLFICTWNFVFKINESVQRWYRDKMKKFFFQNETINETVNPSSSSSSSSKDQLAWGRWLSNHIRSFTQPNPSQKSLCNREARNAKDVTDRRTWLFVGQHTSHRPIPSNLHVGIETRYWHHN